MPRKKRSTRPKRTPLRVRILIAILAVAVIAGIGFVKYLESARGNVLLLDSGFSDYYAPVQEKIDGELRVALRSLNLDKDLKENIWTVDVGDKPVGLRRWKTSCSEERSFVSVNLVLTQAVRQAAGVVRSSREGPSGRSLVLEVGSRRYTTHRIEVTRDHRTVTKMPEPSKKPQLALVIDDFGYSKNGVVESFLQVDLALTLSVIPTLPHTVYFLNRINEEKKQALLHLPMEAEEFTSDVNSVLTSMSDAEIDSLVGFYIDETPGVSGVNNHLGSLATQDRRVMTAVLNVIRARGLFFLDSLTSSKSIAYNTAKSLGVPAARNDIFIDADTEDPNVVAARLERLLEIARNRGYAIGIGHPMPWTLEAIRAYEERFKDSEVELVFLSALVQ